MKKFIIGASTLLPSLALAQSYQVRSLVGITETIARILNLIIPVLIVVAVFVIIWGIFKMVLNADDEDARKTGRSMLLWGVVGIFLMLSVWGLVNILRNTFSLDTTAYVPVDILPTNFGGY